MISGREGLRERMARRLRMLRVVVDHPANRSRRAQALARYAGWQAWRLLVRRPRTVNFWNALRVRVYPDWPYSWNAIYLGLIEYDDMMFTLRYLRPGDVFIDVGANIGFYSLLAASANADAPVVAIEPYPVASARLRENAGLNSFRNIRVREAAAGAQKGTAMLTTDRVDANRIRTADDDSEPAIEVPVVTLDGELSELGIDPASVAMVKIDAEGFEGVVLSGAPALLDAEPGPVWLVEMNGFGTRYGIEDEALHAIFRERGYRRLRYFAAGNRLSDQDCDKTGPCNLIFARRPDSIRSRVADNAPVVVPTS